MFMNAYGSRVGIECSAAFMCSFVVCLSVCLFAFLHDILKVDAARITKLDTDMVHHLF